MSELLDQVTQLLDLLERYPFSSVATLGGVILCYLSLKRAWSGPPVRSNWYIFGLGFIIIIISQLINVADVYIERKVSTKKVFENLRDNSRAKWLIRIIPYNHQKEQEFLSIQNLKKIGHPKHNFVFVADYEELANHTIKEAIYKTGGEIQEKNRVSAVIFPLKETNLYPANVRGILQVISFIDDKYKNTPGYIRFDLIDSLRDDQKNNLKDTGIKSYSWDKYNQYFSDFKKIVEKFRSLQLSILPKTTWGH